MKRPRPKFPNPFWIMLGIDPVEEAVSILGFDVKSEMDALGTAHLRASKTTTHVAVFNLAADPGMAMRRWLMGAGFSKENVHTTIRDIGRAIMKMAPKRKGK